MTLLERLLRWARDPRISGPMPEAAIAMYDAALILYPGEAARHGISRDAAQNIVTELRSLLDAARANSATNDADRLKWKAAYEKAAIERDNAFSERDDYKALYDEMTLTAARAQTELAMAAKAKPAPIPGRTYEVKVSASYLDPRTAQRHLDDVITEARSALAFSGEDDDAVATHAELNYHGSHPRYASWSVTFRTVARS